MKQKQTAQPLLEFHSGISHPWGLFADVLMARHPAFRFINYFRTKVARPDPRFMEMGFAGYELGLWSGSLFDQAWSIDERRLSAFLNSEHQFLRFHACFEMMPTKLKGIFFNIADGSESNVRALKAQITVTSTLSDSNKTMLVVHPGFVESKNDARKGMDNLKKVIDQVLYFAEENNVVIALENLPYIEGVYFLGSYVEELKEIVDDFDSEFVKITFDWGHMNILAYKENVPNNFDFIEEKLHMLGGRIVHAHLNYNKCCETHWKPTVPYSKKLLKKIMRKFSSDKDFDLFTLDPLDEHMPLVRAMGEYRAGLERNIKTLFEVSDINNQGFFTNEIEPQKIFSFFTHKSEGATVKDHKHDLVFLKELLR